MKRFAVFKPSLQGSKLETFEQLQIYAKKYPRKTLSEIIQMDEIRKFHATKDLLQRAQSREKLDYHFSNISDLLKKAKPEAEDYFYELKQQAIGIISDEKDAKAKIPLIKNMYKKALRERFGV